MAWVYLIVAGLLEVTWAVGLKYAEGLTRLWPAAIALAIGFVSFVLLGLAMKTLPVGTAYSVWTGIGAVGSTIFGIILFQESSSPLRMMCIALIVVGIVGLGLIDTQAGQPVASTRSSVNA